MNMPPHIKPMDREAFMALRAKERAEQIAEHLKLGKQARRIFCDMPAKYADANLANAIEEPEKARKAVNKARQWASKPAATLCLVGNPGTGKTWLICAILNELLNRDMAPVYMTAAGMVRKIRGSWARDAELTEAQVIGRIVGYEVLAIDELGGGNGTENERTIISEIICARLADDRPTIIATNLNKDGIIAATDERVLDRLRDGVIAVCDWESRRGK